MPDTISVSFSPTIQTLIERMPYRPYCSDNLSEGVHVVAKEDALRNRFIQFNPPSQVQAFCIDIDNHYSFEAAEEANVLPPSIFVENPNTGHGHGIYIIKEPITVSSKARLAPQRWLAGIERGYTRRMNGDVGYSGLLCRNPLTHPIIDSGRLYGLAELDSCLDFEDKAPYYNISEETGTGRNVTMFDTARTWAYRKVVNFECQSAFYESVLQKCREINAGFRFCLSDSEPRATAKSIAKWVWERRFQFADKKVNRGAYGCTRKEVGPITASRIQTANDMKIEQAINTIIKSGKYVSNKLIANVAKVSLPTVKRYMRRMAKNKA